MTEQEWDIFTRKAKPWLAAALWIAAIIYGVNAYMQQSGADGGSHEEECSETSDACLSTDPYDYGGGDGILPER